MQRPYTVNPVECQPSWEAVQQPVTVQWGRGYLAVAILSVIFTDVVILIHAAWLLGGGS